MRALLGVIRMVLACMVVVIGLVACALAPLMSRRFFFTLARIWHRTLLLIIGIKIHYSGDRSEKTAFFVGNHVSWADILVVGAHWPVVFLARSDIANWPILGWIIKVAGTLFIERGKGAEKALKQIKEALEQGQSVVIFPEGKTSDGSSVRKMQPRLFQAAIDANSELRVFCLKYQFASGALADSLTYEGSVTFMQSFWRTVSGPAVDCYLTVKDPEPAQGDRQSLAKSAESWVANLLKSN